MNGLLVFAFGFLAGVGVVSFLVAWYDRRKQHRRAEIRRDHEDEIAANGDGPFRRLGRFWGAEFELGETVEAGQAYVLASPKALHDGDLWRSRLTDEHLLEMRKHPAEVLQTWPHNDPEAVAAHETVRYGVEHNRRLVDAIDELLVRRRAER